MAQDPYAQFKSRQREMWATFAPMAVYTTPVAAHPVRFAGVSPGLRVLDVGTGTGVVALTAARAGARVTALDLTLELLEQARDDATVAGLHDIEWSLGDAEELPYPDASFDVVLSQFGHMFAPRPDLAVAQMRHVLKPVGRVAFATWPPEHFTGLTFAFGASFTATTARRRAAPAVGQSGRHRRAAGHAFGAPFVERGTMAVAAISLAHYRVFMERSVGPIQALVARLTDEPQTLREVRAEFEALVAPYYVDNVVHQSYLLTRAQAR